MTRARKAAEEMVDMYFAEFAGREGMIAELELRLLALFGSCAARAAEDEPIFTLRAQDPDAPYCVRVWASFAARNGTRPEKVEEARQLADRMEAWQAAHGIKAPD